LVGEGDFVLAADRNFLAVKNDAMIGVFTGVFAKMSVYDVVLLW
jgi:hypothetical protein